MEKLNVYIKRLFDLFVSTVVIVILFPFYIMIALLIKLSSPGPILFKQVRVGRNGKNFHIYKFRTMVVGADKVKDGLAVKSGDARITKEGVFLRKTSLDELPQFFNVFLGDLSIVGPRPALPEQLHYYDKVQLRRLEMQPGITGLATIKGRASIPWSQRILYDIEYIDNFSFWLDIIIMYKTIFVVLSGKGTYYDPKNGPAFDLASPDDLPQSGKIKTIKDIKIDNT